MKSQNDLVLSHSALPILHPRLIFIFMLTRQDRWVHCDTCEEGHDKPLLYEYGWNKKLTYVMAFAIDDIQDVTWRYTTHQSQVLARRKEIREQVSGLISFL